MKVKRLQISKIINQTIKHHLVVIHQVKSKVNKPTTVIVSHQAIMQLQSQMIIVKVSLVNQLRNRNKIPNLKNQQRENGYMNGLSQETFNDLNAFIQANGVAPLAYSSNEQARANSQAEYNAKTET